MTKVQKFRMRLVNAHYLDLLAPSRHYVRDATLRMVGATKQKDVCVVDPAVICIMLIAHLSVLRGSSQICSLCAALPR